MICCRTTHTEEAVPIVHLSRIKLATMMYLGIVLLCLAVVSGSFCNEDIHKYMSPEEVLRVFHTDHDSVPKYEIAKVHLPGSFHKRDLSAGSEMYIKAFGKDIKLWLHPRDSTLVGEDTPVYIARNSLNKPGVVEYVLIQGTMRIYRQIFEDTNRLASLVIGTESSGRTTVNGFIESDGIAVRSLPTRVAEEYRRRRRSVGELDDLNSPYHVVFETSKLYEGKYPVLPVNVEALQQIASQNASEIPDILYPEILVVIEHSIRRAYDGNTGDLLQYIVAFWNGVDLKYRSLMAPRVRLHISYIVLAEDDEATPYIWRNQLNRNAFDFGKALYEAVFEFFNDLNDTFPLGSYDVSVTMTLKDFGINGTILGVAYAGTACLQNSMWTRSNALIHDNAAFSGIITAAHELGHLLGAGHDENKCMKSDGFLMSSSPKYTTNSSDFSTCSLEYFKSELNNLDCLRNEPSNHGRSLLRLMPGRMKNLEEQCKALKFGAPCQVESEPTNVCVNFYCLNENDECKETRVGALDGTSCEKGTNKFCLHMQCVSL